MSAHSTAHSSSESSIWSTINLIIAGVLGAFTALWAATLLYGAIDQRLNPPLEPIAASSAPAQTPTTSPETPAPAPASTETAGSPAQAAEAFEITMKPAGAAGMEYDTKAFTVKAGQKVILTFENTHPIPQPHNVVFGKPGTKDKLMMEAMQMAASPDGMAKGYVPDSEDVLFHTKLLQPTQTEVLEFTAPAEAGQYVYLCTFPGHAMLMNGIMTVE
jgi:azurin